MKKANVTNNPTSILLTTLLLQNDTKKPSNQFLAMLPVLACTDEVTRNWLCTMVAKI